MQQFRASAFNMVVRWRKLDEMVKECTSHISVIYAKNYQIWWRFDKVLIKTSWVIFLAHPACPLYYRLANLLCLFPSQSRATAGPEKHSCRALYGGFWRTG